MNTDEVNELKSRAVSDAREGPCAMHWTVSLYGHCEIAAIIQSDIPLTICEHGAMWPVAEGDNQLRQQVTERFILYRILRSH